MPGAPIVSLFASVARVSVAYENHMVAPVEVRPPLLISGLS